VLSHEKKAEEKDRKICRQKKEQKAQANPEMRDKNELKE
jgi:hypothetical protein